MSTLFLITTVVGLSVALWINNSRLSQSENQVDLLYEKSPLIRNSSFSTDLKIRQHFQLPPYVFKYSVTPPVGETYRIFVGTAQSDATNIRVVTSETLEVNESNSTTISVTLIRSDSEWRCHVRPNGTESVPIHDLDWIEPIAHIGSGSHLPEFGRIESFQSGRTFLALVSQNNHESHPMFVEAANRTVLRAGPLNRTDTNPGMIFAIWIEPDNEDNNAMHAKPDLRAFSNK